MWKFLEGVKPPDKKNQISENQKEDRNKVYEIYKRKHKYQKSWGKDREWLHYIVDRNLMNCTICEKLRPTVLSDLLFIMFHTEDIASFDPVPAIEMWNISGQQSRRPYGLCEHCDYVEDNVDIFAVLDPDFDKENY